MLYDVFLSHASADKPAVEHLAHKLREAGLEPFLDEWHLIPGEPWQETLEDALDQSRTCAVFLGKTLGPWQNEEMRSALETRVRDAKFRVIPVLLPGGKEPALFECFQMAGWSPAPPTGRCGCGMWRATILFRPSKGTPTGSAPWWCWTDAG